MLKNRASKGSLKIINISVSGDLSRRLNCILVEKLQRNPDEACKWHITELSVNIM